jgi:hypothetical protein
MQMSKSPAHRISFLKSAAVVQVLVKQGSKFSGLVSLYTGACVLDIACVSRLASLPACYCCNFVDCSLIVHRLFRSMACSFCRC